MLMSEILSSYFYLFGASEWGLFLPLLLGDPNPGVAFEDALCPLNENDFHDFDVIVFV